jgi:hypothetical protein
MLKLFFFLCLTAVCYSQPTSQPIGTVEDVKDSLFTSGDSFFIVIPQGRINQLKRRFGRYSEIDPIEMDRTGLYILPIEIIYDPDLNDTDELFEIIKNLLVRKIEFDEFPRDTLIINRPGNNRE